jgi:hypothetical protein
MVEPARVSLVESLAYPLSNHRAPWGMETIRVVGGNEDGRAAQRESFAARQNIAPDDGRWMYNQGLSKKPSRGF